MANKHDLVNRIKSNFPQELRDLDQWVCWRIEGRDGKPTKIPYSITGNRASSDNPATWSGFDAACKAFLSENYNGVGFVFSEYDPYTGVDFDKCLNRGEIEPEKRLYVTDLNSYTERSQSGTGIHVIVRALLPSGGRKSNQHNIEMYDRTRFFVVTGDRVEDYPKTINNRQAQIEKLHKEIFPPKQPKPETSNATNNGHVVTDDQALLDLMFASRNGVDIQALWLGGTSPYNDDESAADLALCNHLAFWTGNDPARMDRLFRQSRLYREHKWDRNARTGEKYGEGTIARAIAATKETYKPTAHINGTSKTKKATDPDTGQIINLLDIAPKVHTNGTSHSGEAEYIPLGNIYQAPPLPEDAQLTDEELCLADSSGVFLKNYVQFACQASPMTPTEFHVAAGLSAASIAIARRVHVRVGSQKIYPNLYTLFVGESTLHRKTTGLYILQGLLERAGMVPMFTLAERQTPEAFTEDMSLSVPRTYDSWTDTAKAAWLQRRSLAAQRGWVLDEASHLLDSFSRDYTSGLLPVVLDLYDSKDRGGERQTKSYGSEIIEKAYLNIFGCTTYGAMAEHMSKASHWRNGLFARFALVTSDAKTEWQFWPSPIEHPHDLVNHLRYMAFALFGNPPKAEIIEEQAEEGQPKFKRVELLHMPDNTAIFGDGAWQAWERYARAVSHDMLYQAKGDGSVEDLVFANYGRFPTMMIKVAMIFAVMDADNLPIVIEPKHIFAAQQIVESWRSSLHKVRAGGRISEQKTKVDEIKAILGKNGPNWTSKRDLLRAMNAAWSDIEQTIKDLEAAGEVEIVSHSPARGPKSEKYRLLSAVAAFEETVILS